jgi:hypothetical protein
MWSRSLGSLWTPTTHVLDPAPSGPSLLKNFSSVAARRVLRTHPPPTQNPLLVSYRVSDLVRAVIKISKHPVLIYIHDSPFF